jgi:penicillin-binding protein 2
MGTWSIFTTIMAKKAKQVEGFISGTKPPEPVDRNLPLGLYVGASVDLDATPFLLGGAALKIELPGERAGVIPDPTLKTKRHEDNPKAFPEGNWYTGDNVLTAIGQGDVLVTPLQLANAYATFANGGTVYQPHVVARVMQPLSNPNDPAAVVRVIEPVVIGKVDLPSNVRDPIHQGLLGVASSREGTAVGAWQGFNQSAFPVASKTGTAQVNGKADTSVYAAYAPADAPRYAAAAVLEEAGFGADAAAPVIRHVFEVISGQNPTPVTSHSSAVRD